MFLTVVIAILLLAVTVLVTVITLRPPATTTAPPPPQATGRPAEATTPPPTTTPMSTASVPPPVTLPQQTWTPTWPRLNLLTMPGGGFGYTADLDIPLVEQGNAIGPDLAYYNGRLEQDGAALMGTGPPTLPTPEDCSYATKSLTVSTVTSAEDMVPGTTAWCIVTKKGNLVWLHLLSGGGRSGAYTLRFELMQWKKTS